MSNNYAILIHLCVPMANHQNAKIKIFSAYEENLAKLMAPPALYLHMSPLCKDASTVKKLSVVISSNYSKTLSGVGSLKS